MLCWMVEVGVQRAIAGQLAQLYKNAVGNKSLEKRSLTKSECRAERITVNVLPQMSVEAREKAELFVLEWHSSMEPTQLDQELVLIIRVSEACENVSACSDGRLPVCCSGELKVRDR